jgi:hypothetical protein
MLAGRLVAGSHMYVCMVWYVCMYGIKALKENFGDLEVMNWSLEI